MTPEVIAAKNAIEWRDKRIAELEAALAPLAKVGQLIKDTTPPGIATHSLLYSPAAGLEYSLNSQHALDAYAALNKEQS